MLFHFEKIGTQKRGEHWGPGTFPVWRMRCISNGQLKMNGIELGPVGQFLKGQRRAACELVKTQLPHEGTLVGLGPKVGAMLEDQVRLGVQHMLHVEYAPRTPYHHKLAIETWLEGLRKSARESPRKRGMRRTRSKQRQ